MARFIFIASNLCFVLGALLSNAIAQSPVNVTADSVQMNWADRKAVFVGNVTVTSDTFALKTQHIVATFDLKGERSTKPEIIHVYATGGVDYRSNDETVEAENASYDVVTQVLVLTDNVLVRRDEFTLRGATLTIDLTANTSTMEGQVKALLPNGFTWPQTLTSQ